MVSSSQINSLFADQLPLSTRFSVIQLLKRQALQTYTMLFTTSIALLLAAIDTASAIPAQLYPRQSTVITLEGAGPNPPSISLTPPFDGTNFTTNTDLSISHIVVSAETGVCSFQGIDGATPFIVGEGTVDVGPPQVLLTGKCCAFYCEGYPVNNCPLCTG